MLLGINLTLTVLTQPLLLLVITKVVQIDAADLGFADLEAVQAFQLFTGSLTSVVPTGSDGTVPGVQVSEFTEYDAVNGKINFYML